MEMTETRDAITENLDCMRPDELLAYANRVDSLRPTCMHPDFRVYADLAMYARLKSGAMEDREQGEIEAALTWEHKCERIYQTLPQWAKW